MDPQTLASAFRALATLPLVCVGMGAILAAAVTLAANLR